MSQGLYLYCLARLSRLPPLALQGLDGVSPLEVESWGDVAAVWSPVALEEFCGAEAAARFQDLVWVGPRVVRQQEVVAAIMAFSPVLPVRFGTIFSSRERLAAALRRHHEAAAAFLQEMTGQEEWAVKGMLDQAGAQEKWWALKLGREAQALEALSPGKRYFQEKRLREQSDRELTEWLKHTARELARKLKDQAVAFRERRLISRQATGRDQEMVWNWAFLVPQAKVSAFKAEIQAANTEHQERGLALECTGPWPPYSFCPALEMEASV
jgi:hypothetical protein